jgi:hypothetical protein
MRIVLLAAVALALAGCGSSGGKAPSASELAPVRTPYSPKVDPADFVTMIDNPLFPLRPGTTFLYRGERGRVRQVDEEVVTHRTKEILGIACTVVLDTVSERGRPIERTLDFYAQDRDGNVWYLGEDSFELEGGHFVKASDSWQSGVDGAKPGIIMPADPQAGDKYRQEYYPQGEALDEAEVLGERGPVTVPYGTFERPLVTSEYSPLEPQTEQKFYAAGVGEVLERVVKGHHEDFRLVAVTH